MHFGTARAVKGAALEDLEKAPGISRATARQLYDYFHPARMRFETNAIVCALRNHGEHGAVVRLMTPEHGLQAAYVRGARGRRMRPVLIAGNVVQAQLSARTDTQLPQATLELVHSRAPLLSEPLPAAAIEWATVLTATVLPGRPALSATVRGARSACSTPSRRRRRRSAGGRRWSASNFCCSPSSASASTSTAARSPAPTISSSPSVRNRAARSARRRPSLMQASCLPLPRFRARRRYRFLGGNRARARPHGPFPDPRPDHRTVAADRRSAFAAGRTAAPGWWSCLVVQRSAPAKLEP